MANKDSRIEWQAPEYEFRKKTPDWFWAVGIITLGVMVSAFFLGNPLFGVLVLVAGFNIALYGARKPRAVNFAADTKRIHAGKTSYSYENLSHFWIEENKSRSPSLLLVSKQKLSPLVSIPLPWEKASKLRDFLVQKLKEEKIEESFVDILADKIKI